MGVYTFQHDHAHGGHSYRNVLSHVDGGPAEGQVCIDQGATATATIHEKVTRS